MTPIKTPKKLIEVALPLDAINKAAAREKSIRHGHPSTLHLWWARRPLAAARAVIFAQMVNDPGYERHLGRGVNKEKAALERERLFKIIEDLVKWENTNKETVLERAREEIKKSWRETCELNKNHPQAAELFNPDKLPAFHDPFAGGGALPLEAQRLGLESYASDLNPVAVTINKAMIEIPPRFAGRAPVGPLPPSPQRGRGVGGEGELFEQDWPGATGLAEDVRRYGAWMREEAEKRIGHLYPKIEVTAEMAAERPDLKPLLGQKLTVIAWLWARTVKSPNPAFSHVDVPLASTFVLSSKAGKEAYVQPEILPPSPSGRGAGGEGGYRFTVKVGTPPESAKNGTKLARGANFQCLLSESPIEPKYIKAEGMAGRMGARLMAIVAEGARGRVYLAPTTEHEAIAAQAQPAWQPETSLPDDPRSFWTIPYGLKTYGDLFTPRQLVALTTFSDLVSEAIEKCRRDALAAWGAGVPPAIQHIPPAIQNGQDARSPAARPPTWYRRGDKHPPHYDAPHLTQFVTFRLADTLPQERLREWKEELAAGRISDAQYRQQAEDWLDKGMGSCWLKDERIAHLVQDALLHFDGIRYSLHGWVIMPNHVHVVFSPHEPHRLADILHSWKSYTAKQANRLLGHTGAFWQEDYFDRFMRDESELNDTLTYLAYNPVVAGLSATPEQYPFAGGRASRPSEFGLYGKEDGQDARPPEARLPEVDDRPLAEGGTGAMAYAQAVGVYLAFAISRTSDPGQSRYVGG